MEEIKVRALIQDEISGKMRKIASGTKQNFGTMQKAAGGVTAGMKELALILCGPILIILHVQHLWFGLSVRSCIQGEPFSPCR